MAILNGIDYIILIILFFSIVMGIWRGLAKEVMSLVAWVAAFLVSSLYAARFAELFSRSSTPVEGIHATESASLVALVISYLLLFIGTLLCGYLIKYVVNYAIEGGGISVTNRFLGAFFGLVRGCFVVLLVMFVIGFTPLNAEPLWKESKFVDVFQPGVKWLNVIAQPYLFELEMKMKMVAKNLNQESVGEAEVSAIGV